MSRHGGDSGQPRRVIEPRRVFAAVNKTCASATFLAETEDVRPLNGLPRARRYMQTAQQHINTSKRLLPFFSQLTETLRDVRESNYIVMVLNAVRQYEELWRKSAEDNLLWTVTANLGFDNKRTASLWRQGLEDRR